MKLLLALSVALLALIPLANFAAQPVMAQDKIVPKTRQPSGIAAKTDPAAVNLINQGKSLYKSQKFKEALEKFQTVIRLEPENDEALFYAAVTAFRLDNQAQSREYFLRRADLPNQKSTVKAFCYYRVALTYWRESHGVVAKYGRVENGKPVYQLPDAELKKALSEISSGLDYVGRALKLSSNFVAAQNIKNLIHSEAALVETNADKAKEHREQAIKSLRRSLELSPASTTKKQGEDSDFSLPTIRIAEIDSSKEEVALVLDPMRDLIQGGRAIRRVQPIFRSSRLGRTPDNGEPIPSVNPGVIKVEILVSTTGDVVFAQVIDGRSDYHGAAIVAARGWRFEPATIDGKPVQISSVLSFALKP
ncbi:MAG: tetratricopeptide repeat protein [Acidobacteria bacterium]|nr:tetratricopeptide repeat protein [Acidobacteriota bacterium]